MDARPTITAKPGFRARLARELKRLCIVALIGSAAVITAKFWGFSRLDEEIRARVENRLREHYQGLDVHVRYARRLEGQGIEIRGVTIAEVGGGAAPILVSIEEIFAECDTHFPDFITQTPKIRQTHVRGMKLRAQRHASGFWNLSHLLPLPMTKGEPCPATITDATLEIIDPSQSSKPLTLRNLELSVAPQAAPGRPANSQSAPGALGAPGATLLYLKGTLAGDHLEKAEVEGWLNPISGGWELNGAVTGLEFSPRLRGALPRELATLLQPLSSVRGRTQFSFHVARPAPSAISPGNSPIQFTVDGKISEGRVDDVRLPDPLTDVEAAIHADNRGVRVSNLSARWGSAQVEKLNFDLQGYSAASPAKLTIQAREIDIDRLPLASLPQQLQGGWKRFSPHGIIGLTARFQFDGRAWRPELTVQCSDLSVLDRRFPYRLNEGAGTLGLTDRLLKADLMFGSGGQKMHYTANLELNAEEPLGWVKMESLGSVPLEERMIVAFEPQVQKIIRDFNPRGSISFTGMMWRKAGDVQSHRESTIHLHDCSVRHEKFPYPIDKVNGTLHHADDVWTFRNLSGRNDTASIVGEGRWQANPADGNHLLLKFSAVDVPLEDELRDALAPAAQRVWTNLRPRGTVDNIAVTFKYSAATHAIILEAEGHKALAAHSGSLNIEPTWFPYRLDELTGDFSYRNGIVTMKNVRANHGKTSHTAEGVCIVQPSGEVSVQLEKIQADRVQLDQELLNAFPAGLGQALGRLNVSGPINVDGKVQVTVPKQAGAAPLLDWDLGFDMENGRLELGAPVEHVRGQVFFRGQSNGAKTLCRGELRIDSALVQGVYLSNIQGPLLIDSQRILAGTWAEREIKGRSPRWIRATAFDGELLLDGEVVLSSDSPFQLHATLEGAQIPDLVAELAPNQSRVVGKLNGELAVHGSAQGAYTWRGDGKLRLYDADLYELPAMVSLLKLLSIRRPTRSGFTSSDMDFKIEGDELEFSRIELKGDAITLKGKGRLNRQKNIDMKFYTQLGRDEMQMPLLRPVLWDLNREFLLIEATGSLDNPEIRKQAFPHLNERLQNMFPELGYSPSGEPIRPRVAALRGAKKR